MFSLIFFVCRLLEIRNASSISDDAGAAFYFRYGAHDSLQAGRYHTVLNGRLEIVRALATVFQPLLLDEPAAGMNPSEIEELMRNIIEIRDALGIAILLIEHDMKLVMASGEGIAAFELRPLIIAKGTAEEIQTNDEVIAPTGREKGGLTGC